MDLDLANKELEAFAYSVSNGLRTPLRHMVGYTELLQGNIALRSMRRDRSYMGIILDAAKRMGMLMGSKPTST